MSRFDLSQKYKGLINGKVWESGSIKLFGDGLAVIYRDNAIFYVYEESISKSTGYFNSDGEEIFEGDILALEDGFSVVFWDNVYEKWKIDSYPNNDPLSSVSLENCLDFTLIGHVFTHEYLLKSQMAEVHKH